MKFTKLIYYMIWKLLGCKKQEASINRNQKKNQRRTASKKIKEIKAFNGCALCPEIDICCLEFHHFNKSEKHFTIGSGCSASWIKIQQEVDKCICLCSNCHRKVEVGKLKVDTSMKCKLPDKMRNTSSNCYVVIPPTDV